MGGRIRMRTDHLYEAGPAFSSCLYITDTLTAYGVPGASFTRSILLNLGVIDCYDRLLLDSAVYSRALDSATSGNA